MSFQHLKMNNCNVKTLYQEFVNLFATSVPNFMKDNSEFMWYKKTSY